MASVVAALVWGLALSCWNKMSQISAFFLVMHFLRFFKFSIQSSKLTLAPFSRKSVSKTHLGFQNTVNITFPAEALILNFFGAGDSLWQYTINCFFVLRIIMMDPSFITCHYQPYKSHTFLFKMTQKFPWNSGSFTCHLIYQFSDIHLAQSFWNPRRLIMCPTLSLEIPPLDMTIFSNHFFNTFMMWLICCSHWPPHTTMLPPFLLAETLVPNI